MLKAFRNCTYKNIGKKLKVVYFPVLQMNYTLCHINNNKFINTKQLAIVLRLHYYTTVFLNCVLILMIKATTSF